MRCCRGSGRVNDIPGLRVQRSRPRVFEFSDGGFRIRDLGSMNGTQVNGAVIKARDLDHGDRLRIGEHSFQFILEKREPEPNTYVLSDA
jgi:pSer/pThr/pTyr-binding forkhead associated (FHA) protein